VEAGALAALEYSEKMRLRAAAFRATRLYPGPVGAVLAAELGAWEEFGYRLGGASLINQLADHILAARLPNE
jgi:hypothetical protein